VGNCKLANSYGHLAARTLVCGDNRSVRSSPLFVCVGGFYLSLNECFSERISSCAAFTSICWR
jgi:hypothetical protein